MVRLNMTKKTILLLKIYLKSHSILTKNSPIGRLGEPILKLFNKTDLSQQMMG